MTWGLRTSALYAVVQFRCIQNFGPVGPGPAAGRPGLIAVGAQGMLRMTLMPHSTTGPIRKGVVGAIRQGVVGAIRKGVVGAIGGQATPAIIR